MEANEAMKAMARRIMLETIPHHDYAGRGVAYDAALAAIMETQARDAALVEGFDLRDIRASEHGVYLATAIRAGDHYALAGER